MDTQDSTLLHSQAQKEIITPEKSLATKQNLVPNEQTSSFEVETQIKDTAILSKETNKTNQNVRKHSVQTGIPNEFKDEVRINDLF